MTTSHSSDRPEYERLIALARSYSDGEATLDALVDELRKLRIDADAAHARAIAAALGRLEGNDDE